MRAASAGVHGGIGGWHQRLRRGGVVAALLGLVDDCVAEVTAWLRSVAQWPSSVAVAVAYALPLRWP